MIAVIVERPDLSRNAADRRVNRDPANPAAVDLIAVLVAMRARVRCSATIAGCPGDQIRRVLVRNIVNDLMDRGLRRCVDA